MERTNNPPLFYSLKIGTVNVLGHHKEEVLPISPLTIWFESLTKAVVEAAPADGSD